MAQLFYNIFLSGKVSKLDENSDGVVPLSSQLHDPAQRQAAKQLSINTSHAGILTNESAMMYVIETIERTEVAYPDDHMRYNRQGGFDVVLDDTYSGQQRYIIRHYGKILRALALGEIEPVDEPQRKYLRAVLENTKPRNDAEMAWVKFIADRPNWAEME